MTSQITPAKLIGATGEAHHLEVSAPPPSPSTTRPQPSKPLPLPLVFSESPYDRFLILAFQKEIVDTQGTIIKILKALHFPVIDARQLNFLRRIYNTKITVSPNKPGLPSIDIAPKDFILEVISNLGKQGQLNGSVRHIGGVVRAVMNPKYLIEIWSRVFSKRKPSRIILPSQEVLPDYDYAIPIVAKSQSELVEQAPKSVVEALCTLHNKEHSVTEEDVKEKGFRLPLRPLWCENHMLVAKIGNSEKQIDVKLFEYLDRLYLFTVDAFEIDLEKFIKDPKENPQLHCLIPEKEWQCVMDLSARLIRAYNPEKINKYGWPRMMMLITNKYRCLQSSLDKILWEELAEEEPACNLFPHLRRCLLNHFPKRTTFAKAYFINACIHLLKGADKKNELLSISYLWGQNEKDLLSPSIDNFLKEKWASFHDVLLMLQLSSTILYAFGDQHVLITQHLDESHFQLTLPDKVHEASILIPVNPSIINDFSRRLSELGEVEQKAFLHAFDEISREFKLMPALTAQMKEEKKKKLEMLKVSFEGLPDCIPEFKAKCPTSMLVPFLSLSEGLVDTDMLAFVPELTQSCPEKSLMTWFKGFNPREEVLETLSAILEKPPQDHDELLQTFSRWIKVLGNTGDSELLRAAELCWKRLLEIADTQQLGEVAYSFALDAAQADVSLATNIIEFAVRQKIWEGEPQKEVEVLFSVLSHFVRQSKALTVNKDVLWLNSEKTRQMILESIDRGLLPGKSISGKVLNGMLWMVNNYAEREKIELGEKLLHMVSSQRGINGYRNGFCLAESMILRAHIRKDSCVPKRVLGEMSIASVAQIARETWNPEEQKKLFVVLLKMLQEKPFPKDRLRMLCEWLKGEKKLIGTSKEGIQFWNTLLVSLLNDDKSYAWELWANELLPLYLQSRNPSSHWKAVAQSLQLLLRKYDEIVGEIPIVDQRKIVPFLREGLQDYDLSAIRMGQILEQKKLCERINWDLLLQEYELPKNLADRKTLKRFDVIVERWTAEGELDLAESWLFHRDVILSSHSLHKGILLKRLVDSSRADSVKMIENAWQDKDIIKLERQQLWEQELQKANGWKALRDAPLEVLNEITNTPEWNRFFCLLAVEHPDYILELVRQTKWLDWLQKRSGKQIPVFVQFGLQTSKVKNHIIPDAVDFQDIEEAKSALLSELEKRPNVESIYLSLELLGMCLNLYGRGSVLKKSMKKTVEQCNPFLRRANKAMKPSLSSEEKESILRSALALSREVIRLDVDGFNFNGLFTLFMHCDNPGLIDSFKETLALRNNDARAEKKYQELLEKWEPEKPKQEERISALARIISFVPKAGLRLNCCAFVAGATLTCGALVAVNTVAYNYFDSNVSG